MSTLAMRFPSHSSLARDYPWEGPRALTDFAPQQSEKISLPSIRQAFPELQLRIPSPHESLPSATTSPTTGIAAATTPPGYTCSPNSNKRRRYSIDDEGAGTERASRVPRLYVGGTRQPSPQRTPASEGWASAKTSPFLPNGAMSVIRSPPTLTLAERPAPVERAERSNRPNMPVLTLPHVAYERDQQPIPRSAPPSQDDYQPPPGPPMPAAPHAPLTAPLEATQQHHHHQQQQHHHHHHHAPPPAYRSAPFTYRQYHHPSRVQSLSVGSVHPFDARHYGPAPAAAPAFPPHVAQHYHPAFVRYDDMAHIAGGGGGGDTRQRKRRGNLPKETTDKLRGWFVAHLHHPYPTEDEKQELMRQTGLQMNQISNWFINARRRQLPTMISNARAESDALNAAPRGAGGKIMPTTERPDHPDDKAKSSTPVSDGESSLDGAERARRGGQLKRGSI